jgi:hypothetical protein
MQARSWPARNIHISDQTKSEPYMTKNEPIVAVSMLTRCIWLGQSGLANGQALITTALAINKQGGLE